MYLAYSMRYTNYWHIDTGFELGICIFHFMGSLKKSFLPIRERIPANAGSDKDDAGTVREMRGISRDLVCPVSGDVQLNSGLSDSRSTMHLCWHTVFAGPHTDGPKNQAKVQSDKRSNDCKVTLQFRGQRSKASSTSTSVHLHLWLSNKNKTFLPFGKLSRLIYVHSDWSYHVVEEQAEWWPHHLARWRLTAVLGSSCRCVCWHDRWNVSLLHSNTQNPEAEWTDLAKMTI